MSKSVGAEGDYLELCEAVLLIPKFVFKDTTTAVVTLKRVSSEGLLPGQSTRAIGPVFSVSKGAPFTEPAKLELTFQPLVPGIPRDRMKIAYWELVSRLWIVIQESKFDSAKGVLFAPVYEGWSYPIREFAPFASCSSDADCLSPLPPKCKSNLCQQ